jgi:hypothetical protein
MPNWLGPLLALAAILAFLYIAFVKNIAFVKTKRPDPSGRRDEDHVDYV